jgi:hypothetical protein
VVSGEVGGGPCGLCHTVPDAVARSSAAIVYGHGVFTIDPIDFNGALDKLIDIETRCRIEYFNRLNKISLDPVVSSKKSDLWRGSTEFGQKIAPRKTFETNDPAFCEAAK